MQPIGGAGTCRSHLRVSTFPLICRFAAIINKKRKDCKNVNVLKKINDGLMAFIKIVLIFAGTLMTCLVIMNVILRYVFSSGLS